VTRIERSHTLPVSLEHGFSYVTDPANWHEFWPGFVRIAERGAWEKPGDTLVLVVRLLGRERDLRMELERFEPGSLVVYRTTQRGLPDARHERRFEAASGALLYTLAVEYEPRGGLAGLADRTLLRRGIARAMRQTFASLDRIFRQRQ
jgi:polyketide cyclase/dehydrase/lipid transport protein